MLKRAFDVAAAALGLLVLAPLAAVIACAVRIDSRGPVLHRAVRTGRSGRPFLMLKFRTMRADAARRGPGVTTKNDERVTRVGRWLRRTKLDEIPQLVNVLRGDMSVVGPRPEDPRYIGLYTERQRRVLEVRPGITSAASVAYRNEAALLAGPDCEREYVERILPAKLAIELEYIERPALARDARVIWRTLLALLR